MTIAGNTNQVGVIPIKTTGQPGRPGKVTRGVGANKPRIHLVSSKGKVPAGVYAEAIALKQKNQAASAASMPTKNETHSLTAAGVKTEQLTNPSGVATRPAPPHQNNPALAGRFTPSGIAHAKKTAAANDKTNPNMPSKAGTR